MKSADDWFHQDVTVSNRVAAYGQCFAIERWIGKTRPETRVRTAAIVMRDPLAEDTPHVAFI
jgi:hypothetical protein